MRVATDHRELILSSAASLFAHKPFHEVLMDDVAMLAPLAAAAAADRAEERHIAQR